MNQATRISFLIPVYNEELNIVRVLKNLFGILRQHPEWNSEVIIVEDGSADKTRHVLLSEIKNYQNAELILHDKNKGYTASLKDGIQKGATLAAVMGTTSLFPPIMVESTAIGERTGAIDEMLLTVAEHFDLEVSHTVKNLTVLLEPLLLIGIFGMVTLLALAIFLPIWNLSTVIRAH